MKKSMIIIILVLIVVIAVFFLNKNTTEDKQAKSTNNIANEQTVYDSNIYDADGNVMSFENERYELPQIPKDKLVQGIVELNRNGKIYIFNGQHFGEFGFEMEEYTSAHIGNKNQKCIDYVTHLEYNTDYIQEGDILICSRDILKEENNLDINDNIFIVLKAKDYDKMKIETLNNEMDFIVTVGEYFDNSGELYLKYNISDENYHFPFALKFNLSNDTKILGNLETGITVKVEYKDLNVPLDELEIQSIEIIEY